MRMPPRSSTSSTWGIAPRSSTPTCGNEAPKFKSTDITGADYGKALELTDHTGKPRHLEDFRGKVVVLFFGFTHCPDVCPTTLVDVSNTLKSLGAEAERSRPAVAGEVFGTAPRELARAVSLQQAVEMVRIIIDVVETQVDELAAPGG